MKPLAIDLFCGLGGWTEGLLAEDFDVIGFDIERRVYGEHRYPAQLVLQDVTTLDGAQLRDAAIIVASPPCQKFSYMAMPWSIGRAQAAAIRADETGALLAELTRLFDACFRIQLEACEAAGRRIPLIVENVRGAVPWVGPARWNFGSYYLWGDVPALMPIAKTFKSRGLNWSDRSKPCDFTRLAGRQRIDGVKVPGLKHGDFGGGFHQKAIEGLKFGGTWWNDSTNNLIRKASSGSSARKQASAMIAKIPLPLSRHIAATFRP
jgi:hypothetical protein